MSVCKNHHMVEIDLAIRPAFSSGLSRVTGAFTMGSFEPIAGCPQCKTLRIHRKEHGDDIEVVLDTDAWQLMK